MVSSEVPLLLDDKQAAHGVVALGAIAPDMFELRIAHADKARPDQSYRVRIHAANPIRSTSAPS